MDGIFAGLGIFGILIWICIIILAILALLMPYFVYRIHQDTEALRKIVNEGLDMRLLQMDKRLSQMTFSLNETAKGIGSMKRIMTGESTPEQEKGQSQDG